MNLNMAVVHSYDHLTSVYQTPYLFTLRNIFNCFLFKNESGWLFITFRKRWDECVKTKKASKYNKEMEKHEKLTLVGWQWGGGVEKKNHERGRTNSRPNQKNESYLPCNGVCLPRSIQNLSALNRNNKPMYRTDQNMNWKIKCKKVNGDGSF